MDEAAVRLRFEAVLRRRLPLRAVSVLAFRLEPELFRATFEREDLPARPFRATAVFFFVDFWAVFFFADGF